MEKTLNEPIGGSSAIHHSEQPSWYKPLLFGVLLVAAFLNFYQLGQDGYANYYYAAAVRSMLISWHNFFFVSFDANGFVAIDKPPLGFWLQVVSAKIFGFSPWSLFLPQVLAGLFSILILAHLVRRIYGPVAALIASATFTLTPVVVVTDRNNTIDSTLVLTMLLAAWAVTIAIERGQLRWLLLCAALIGVGFNVKMLAAYLVVPTFGLLYLLAAPHKWRARILHLLLATIVLIGVSFSWAVAVDLTPATARPYVGSSGDNSVINLAIGYNGLARLSGVPLEHFQSDFRSAVEILMRYGSDGSGGPGFFRILDDQLGGQIGWLFPIALLGLIGVKWYKPEILPLDKQQQGLTLWGCWFLTTYTFFSAAGFFHTYYTVIMAPALSALVGIGIVTCWNDRFQLTRRRWFLPLALFVTALVQVRLLWSYPIWGDWLIPPLACAAVVILIIHSRKVVARKLCDVLTGMCLALLLLAPLAWCVIPVMQDRSEYFPTAGPETAETPFQRLSNPYVAAFSTPDPAQIDYLLQQHLHSPYLVATADASTAAPIILETGRPVMALGGWVGWDSILTRAQFIGLVHRGVVRYFLLPEPIQTAALPREVRAYLLAENTLDKAAGMKGQTALSDWVRSSCKLITLPQSSKSGIYGSGDQIHTLLQLYDCAHT